jgi:hypothetical protein
MQYIEVPSFAGGTEIKVCETEMPDQRARFAMQLMQQLAIVACVPDGENSDGSQKMRIMMPDEVVNRAINIANYALGAFKLEGWLLEIPLPKVTVLPKRGE